MEVATNSSTFRPQLNCFEIDSITVGGSAKYVCVHTTFFYSLVPRPFTHWACVEDLGTIETMHDNMQCMQSKYSMT